MNQHWTMKGLEGRQTQSLEAVRGHSEASQNTLDYSRGDILS